MNTQKYIKLNKLVEKYGVKIARLYDFYDRENKKIDIAINTYAKGVGKDSVLGMIDTTLFKNGKEGMLFTTAGIYIKSSFVACEYIKYNDIESVDKIDADKESKIVLKIKMKDEKIITIDSILYDKIELHNFLEEIIKLKSEGELGEEDKFIVLECMHEKVKINYLKAIVNFTYIDNVIDEKEIAEIYSLMCRINMDTESRIKIREYMVSPKDCINEILDEMDKYIPDSSYNALHVSFLKDIIMLDKSTKSINKNEKEDVISEFIKNIADRYNINEEQIEFLKDSCEYDLKILNGEINDNEIVKKAKELSAQAAGVGVPIAAVYLSGTVGFSAAGITSGLASLGLGGVLGLSSMVTGIGVAILAGVGVYKGIKWITSGGEREKSQKRELLIQQAILNNQRTINNLVEDINWYTEKIVNILEENERNEVMINKLSKELKVFSQALKSLQLRSNKLDLVLNSEEILNEAK